MVSPSKQASKQASIDTHTHVCNAVTLVWGSLRLAPNIVTVTNTYLSRALWFSIFRCCLFVVLPLTVIVVLALVGVVTGVAVHFAQSGEKGAHSQGC